MQTIRLYGKLIRVAGLRIATQRKKWVNYNYHAIVSRLSEHGFWDFFTVPRNLHNIVENFGFKDKEYTELLLEALVIEEVLQKSGSEYYLNPKRFDGITPQLPHITPETDKIGPMYYVVDEYAKDIWLRLNGVMSEFTKDLGLANWDTAWGSEMYQGLEDMAIYAGMSTKKLQSSESLLFVHFKNGQALAYMWLSLPHIKRMIGIDWIPKHVSMANKEFSRHVRQMLAQRQLEFRNPDDPELRPQMIQANPMELPMFEDESFDTIYVDQAFHWLESPERAVDELVRVLKRGGVIFGASIIEYATTSFFNLLVKTRQGASGVVPKEQFTEFFARHGIKVDQKTPIGVFAGIKP